MLVLGLIDLFGLQTLEGELFCFLRIWDRFGEKVTFRNGRNGNEFSVCGLYITLLFMG